MKMDLSLRRGPNPHHRPSSNLKPSLPCAFAQWQAGHFRQPLVPLSRARAPHSDWDPLVGTFLTPATTQSPFSPYASRPRGPHMDVAVTTPFRLGSGVGATLDLGYKLDRHHICAAHAPRSLLPADQCSPAF
jgi:hypothetical protein